MAGSVENDPTRTSTSVHVAVAKLISTPIKAPV